jgi:TonB family protein
MVRRRRDRSQGSGKGARGWPGNRALVAALALHVALGLLLIDWWRPAPEPEQHAVAVALVATEKLPAKEPLGMPALPQPRRSSATLPTPEPTPPASEQPVAPPPERAGDDKTATFTAPPAPSPPPRLDSLKPPSSPAAKPTAPGSSKKPRVPVEPPKAVVREGATPSALAPGVAVYDVVVDARGQIRSVTLTHSSGTTDYDASGEAMIRNGYPLPASDGPDLHVPVSIAFTPEGR